MEKKDIQPVHPGEILFEEFLGPMGLSQNRLANESVSHQDKLMRSCYGGVE